MKPPPDSHPELHKALAWYYAKLTVYHVLKWLRPEDNDLVIPEPPKTDADDTVL